MTRPRDRRRQLTKLLAGEEPRDSYSRRCAFCGRRCRGYACFAHRDLAQLEAWIFSQATSEDPPVSDLPADTDRSQGAARTPNSATHVGAVQQAAVAASSPVAAAASGLRKAS